MRLFIMRERAISAVPKIVLVVLGIALCAQIYWSVHQQALAKQIVQQEPLSAPPSLSTMRLASFGEPIALAKISMLYLQTFDNQPGVKISLRQLDYHHVIGWLTRVIELDPPAQYPLFAASQLYGEVNDEPKQRLALEFIYQQFLQNPNHRWRSLAHAATLARHRLRDLPLAQKYAQAIRLYATSNEVPSWVKQMDIFLLEDMDELQSAKILLGGLLQSGQITDPHEFKFLEQRLIDLEEKEKQKK